MPLTWRQRLEQAPHLRDLNAWPTLAVDHLPKVKRRQFMTNQALVAQALAGTRLTTIAQRHGLTPGRVTQILNRCLGGKADEAPPLTAGLIPHRVLHGKQRLKALPTLAAPSGHGCAFQALLDQVPGLRVGLDALLEASVRAADYAQRPTPYAVHGEFKRLLAEAHWPRDRYPYTTDSIAYQSVRRYAHQKTDDLIRARQAKKARAPKRVLDHHSPRHRALRAQQIDEHTLDMSGKVNLVLNDELIPLRVGRATVLVAMDVDTRCVLGLRLAPTRAPNHEDLLSLLIDCTHPGALPELTTPELAYLPGAVCPNHLPDSRPVSFGEVALDNAWMHRAHPVTACLCDAFGATLGLGLPANPTVRALVESVFDYLNQRFSHRAPSTTGSHPHDPRREARKHRHQPPVITYPMVVDALWVLLTEYNVTPQAALGGATPLSLYQHHCAEHYVRYLPAFRRDTWQPFQREQVVALHWYTHERRQPHVNFLQARYGGDGLITVAGREPRIRVCYDWRDIRTLHATTLHGEDLGDLQVSLSWQRFPHSAATRRYINKQVRIHRLNARDPMAGFFRFLLEHKGRPKYALTLLRVYDSLTGGGRLPLRLDDEPGAVPLDTSTTVPVTLPPRRWHTGMAQHRSES